MIVFLPNHFNIVVNFIDDKQKLPTIFPSIESIIEINKVVSISCLESEWNIYVEQNFKIIEAAGGLVFNDSMDLLFIYRKGKWDLPKGKIEEGEKVQNAAIREVQEETGLQNLVIQKYLNNTWHIYKDKYIKAWVLKKTYWFEMKGDVSETLVPQTLEDITEIAWVSKKDEYKILNNTYSLIKSLIV